MLLSHPVGITLLKTRAPIELGLTSIELGQMNCALQPPVQIPMLRAVPTPPKMCHLRGSIHLGWTAEGRKLVGISKAALVDEMEGGIGVVSLEQSTILTLLRGFLLWCA